MGHIRHHWMNYPNKNNQLCTVCGCKKEIGQFGDGHNQKFTMKDGKILYENPSCIKI